MLLIGVSFRFDNQIIKAHFTMFIVTVLQVYYEYYTYLSSTFIDSAPPFFNYSIVYLSFKVLLVSLTCPACQEFRSERLKTIICVYIYILKFCYSMYFTCFLAVTR